MDAPDPLTICLGDERQSCLRKYRHPNFLSAALHASSIDDGSLHVYGCGYCGGSHVGHYQTPILAKPTPATKLRRNGERLKRAREALRTNDGTMKPTKRQAFEQSIRDLIKQRRILELEAAKDAELNPTLLPEPDLRGIVATLLIAIGAKLQCLGRGISAQGRPPTHLAT
jgi:hypothetical protein